MNPLGLFGTDIFGVGWFGAVQDNIPVLGTVITAKLEAALSQETENKQMVDARVEIAGNDVSTLIESCSIKTEENRVAETCTPIFIGTPPVYVTKGAKITVTAYFRFEDGTDFTMDIFSGEIRSVQPNEGAVRKTVNIIAYDIAESSLSEASKNITWTGTARDLVVNELYNAGFLILDLDFTDYSMTAIDLTGFSKVRDLILAVAGGIDEVVAFIQPNGSLCVKSVKNFRVSGLVVTQKGYTYLQKSDSANSQYKSITVQGNTGLIGSATGTGQIIHTETSPFITTAENCATKAQNIVDRGAAIRRYGQIPLNPLIKKGKTLQIYDQENVLRSCRVTGNSHFIQWSTPDSSPGAWTNISLADI